MRRTQSLHSVGEAVRLYEELERALAQLDVEALNRVAVASRKSAHALSMWTRRLAELRDVERAQHIGITPHTTSRTDAAHPRRARSRHIPPKYVWEAAAFAIGCAVSFLLF